MLHLYFVQRRLLAKAEWIQAKRNPTLISPKEKPVVVVSGHNHIVEIRDLHHVSDLKIINEVFVQIDIWRPCALRHKICRIYSNISSWSDEVKDWASRKYNKGWVLIFDEDKGTCCRVSLQKQVIISVVFLQKLNSSIFHECEIVRHYSITNNDLSPVWKVYFHKDTLWVFLIDYRLTVYQQNLRIDLNEVIALFVGMNLLRIVKIHLSHQRNLWLISEVVVAYIIEVQIHLEVYKNQIAILVFISHNESCLRQRLFFSKLRKIYEYLLAYWISDCKNLIIHLNLSPIHIFKLKRVW